MLFSGIAAALELSAATAATVGATAASTGAAAGVGATAAGTAAAGAGAAATTAASIQGYTALAGLGISAAGLGANVAGQVQASEASKKAEEIRQQQASLTAFREQREIIRKSIAARAIALSNTTSSGAQESSALPGAYGQITSEEARSFASVSQNMELGNQMFRANQQVTSGKELIGFGQGAQDFGKQAVAAAPAVGQVGQTLFQGSNNYKPYGTV